MSELAYRLLTDDELSTGLASLDGWSVEDGKITKTFEFSKYLDGVAFASKVGETAEELNHHPDILLTYGKVKVSVNTHDVGGLSPYDLELARRIERL